MTVIIDNARDDRREAWAEPEITSLNTRESQIFIKYGADGSRLPDSTRS